MMKLLKYILLLLVLMLSRSVDGQTKIVINLQSGSSDTICTGGSINFTSVVTNCTSPTYQWYINGVAQTSQTSQNFSYNNFTNGDVVTCRQTNTTAPCNLDTSNGIKIYIKPIQALNLVTANNVQNICQYNPIVAIKYNVVGASGVNISGLPSGVTGVYSSGVLTISGIPTVNGTFNYQVTTTGSNLCGSTAQVNGTITVRKDASPLLTSGNLNTQQVVFNGQNYFIRCGNSSSGNIQIANATIGNSNISQYKISWGDSSTDTTFSVFPSVLVHNYINGFYTLTFTTTSVDNCSSSVSYGIFVGNSPQGTLGNPGNLSGCSPVSITFPITNTNVNVPGTTYKIDFGDGTIENYTHPNIPSSITHIYTESSCGKTSSSGQANSYAASMTVLNPCSPAVSTISPIQISTSGIPKISVPNNIFCVNDVVAIKDSSSKGGFISGANCLSGNSIYWTITPTTGWTTANNLGSNGGTPNDADNWANGDNSLNVVFTASGSYTVSLHSANGCNLTNPKIKDTIICITSTPTASFTIPKDTLCAGENLSFTSTSNAPSCGRNIYSWSVTPSNISGCSAAATPTFTSGTSDTSANPVINFSKPGSYIVSLTTTIKGTSCTSVAFTKTITVKDKPTITIALSRPTICQGDTVTPIVAATCFATNATYSWTFTNGVPATSNLKNPGGIAFNTTGSNNISVTATNACGNTTQATSVSVAPSPTLTATVVNATICNGQNAIINLSSNQANTKYTWTSTVTSGAATGNNNQSTATSATPINNTLTNTGNVDAVVRYIITVVGATGCVGETKTVDITVRPGTTPPNAGADQNLCNATTTTLAGNNPTVGTGTWTKILGGAATITNANLYNTTITGLLPDIYQFVWTIIGSGGGGSCPNTPDTMKIINRPAITTANAGSDIVVCNYSAASTSVILQGNTASPARSYETGTWTVITKPAGSTTSFSNLNSPTATFIFNKIGNYTLVWTITNDINCTPTTDTVTVKVYEAAVGGNTSGNASVCKNNNAGAIALTGFTGNIVKWQYKILGSSVWVDVANTAASLSYTNLDTTTTYQVIIATTNTTDCPITATSSQTTITVNPIPVISNLVSSSPNQCASNTGSISFNVTPATGSYTVNYTKGGVNQPQLTGVNAVGGVITIPNLSAGLYDNIKLTLNGCSSNTLGPITLSDPTKPATPIVTGNTPICSGGTLNLGISNTYAGTVTYNWSGPNGFTNTILSNPSIANIQTSGTGNYNVTVTIAGCTSDAGTVAIVVNQTPTAPITSPVTYCQNATATALTASGTNLIWYNNAGLTNGSTTAPIPITTTVSSTTYYVIDSSNAGCKSPSSSLVVTVNATPVISNLTKTNPQQCQAANGSISFNVTPTAGSYTINYTKGGVTQAAITGVNPVGGIITISNLTAEQYDNIKVTLNGCPSNTLGSITLNDPTKPATPVIVGVDSICSGKNLILNTATTIAGGTYKWTDPLNVSTTANTLIVNNITTNYSGIFKVSVTVNLCKSDDTTFAVRVDSTPVQPNLSANPVCTDSTIKLFATTVYPMPVTYSWSGPNVFSTTQQNPTIVNAILAMAGNYNAYVTSITGKCQSQTSTVNLIVNETPHITFKDSTNPNKCATPTGNIRLSGLKPNTTYSITYTIGGNTITQSQTSDGIGILKIDTLRAGIYSNIFVTLNACPSNQIGSYALVDPNPPATLVIVGVDSICSGNNLILNVISPIANGIYTWTHPTGNISVGTTYIINNVSLNDNGAYKLYVTLNLCKSKDTSLNVRVDSTPVAPALSVNPVCTDSTIKLFANTVYPMPVTYSWSGVNSFSSTIQNPVIANATLAMAGNYNAFVTSVVGKCPSQTSTVNVVVNETPNVAQLNDTTYKDGTNTGNIIFTGTVANTTFNWTNSNTNIGLTPSGSGTINFTATNTTPVTIFGIITVTPATNFCAGKPMSFKIYVNPTPTLSSKLKDTICTDNLFTYQATSTTPNVKYTWVRNVVAGISNAAAASTDSSGAISETLINTTAQPIDVVYQFKLYSLGTVNSVPFVLTVNPNAKALYIYANDKLCTPAHIDTTNIKNQIFSTANGSYEWYANNVLIGTSPNFPGYTITNNGDIVYIKLKAISAFGCKADSFEHKFYTVKTPTVSFTKSIAKGCGPLYVDFTNTSTPLNASSYLWNFGNGQTSTQQSPTNISFIADTSYNRHDTTYYITLTAITQCDTIKFIDSVTVLPKPRALFQPDTTVGCSVFHFAAFNNSLGTHNTYTWDFGDSTALVIDTAYGYYYHNFKVLTTDTFNVKLKAENVCGVDSFTVNVVVFPNTIVPKLVVDGTNNFGCAPTNIRFINNTRGANKFIVDFGDGSMPYISTNSIDTIYHYYASGGNYTILLKAQNSCTDSTVKLVIQLYDKPVAGFTTSKADYCKNDNISFVNTSDTTLSVYWNFGDGITSTAKHPKHTYAAIGTYTITQIVQSTNASGAVCTDTARKIIVVHEIPSAVFTTNAVLQNCQPYLFEGVAPIIIGYNYNWRFYDNNSIDTVKAGAVGDHIFYKTGLYNVRLIVFNKFGCSDTGYTSVKVIETPKAMFAASDSVVCVPGKSINFTNTTTYSAADAVNYEWYIDGIKQATTTNFIYNFSANPNITTAVVFTVKLIATNTFGCKDSIIKKIVIQPKAIASFQISAAQGCAPFSLQLNNSSQYANIFKWFVDGNLVSVVASPAPLILPTPDKSYIIKLVADHNLGCGADSSVLQFTTYPKPVADFYIPTTTSCNGILKINCFDISKVTGGIIKQWNWSFGDSKTDTAQNPAHTYTIAGAYSVSLWVKDDKNCISDVSYKTVKNFGKPKADFAVGSACLGSNTIPVNLSTVGFGSNAITSYLWNFGDGNLLAGLQPVHKYNTEGTYSVSLIVTADSSCVADTATKQVIVYGKPTANFSFNNTCVNQPTQFNNTSLFGYGQTSIDNSLWSFGDGITGNINNAQHIYSSTGNYSVKLQVSGNRCPNLIDTISKLVIISKPRDGLIYPRIETAKGSSIQLNAVGGGVSYQWLPNNYLDNSFIQNPVASFVLTSPNIINYQIKITDSVGCVATDKQEIWLFANADIFLPTAFTPNGDNANDIFKPLYVSIQKIQYFRVFDRWGKVVFETSDMSKGWDGTFNSKQLPTDTYVWTIAGFSNDGKEILRKGNVTLIRE